MAEENTEPMRARLRTAMAEMANPTKSKTANVGKYSYEYSTLPDVLGIVRPALQAHGLELKQFIKRRCSAETLQANGLTLCTAVFDDDGEMVLDERPVYESKDPQAFGSYETYMRRYSLMTAFGLAADDDDGQAAKAAAKPKAGKGGAAERVEKGIKALMGISPWTRETLAPMLEPLSDDDKVEWLADAYKKAKEQMAEARQ